MPWRLSILRNAVLLSAALYLVHGNLQVSNFAPRYIEAVLLTV
jgi:hypothetical protein